jgi:hypothetical protein
MADTLNRPPLSPAAQAVRDAVVRAEPGQTISAALRSLVEQMGRKTPGGGLIISGYDILAIANELDPQT